MGMSASQARLLSLTRRMSDVEYQGQQINQQRTTLSNQVNALYNSLLEMDVPVPPSTNDYQKLVYTGKLGATEYSFEANSVVPKGSNSYSVVVAQKGYGNTISATTGFSKVDNAPGSVTGQVFEGTKDVTKGKGASNWQNGVSQTDEGYGVVTINGKTIGYGAKITNSQEDLAKVYNDGAFVMLTSSGNAHIYVEPERQVKDNYVIKNEDGTYSWNPEKDPDYFNNGYFLSTEHKLYYHKSDDVESDYKVCTGTEYTTMYIQEGDRVRKATTADFAGKTTDGKYKLKDGVTYITTAVGDTKYSLTGAYDLSVDGKGVFTFEALEAAGVDPETIASYKEAIANSDMQNDNGKNYTWQDFYVVLSNDGKSASFVLKSDLEDGNDNCSTFQYQPNGEYTTKQTIDDCKLKFDPTNGRISLIGIPNYDENGNVVSYTNIRLEAKSVTDEDAYNDAMAEYNYNKSLYDKKQENINKQTEIIQQQDKNLELKLTRLDNERNAVNTETEAVKKVIQDNIDKSYKTFSG
jgi:hypothetical protein